MHNCHNVLFNQQSLEGNNQLFIIIKLQNLLAKSHDSATVSDEIH